MYPSIYRTFNILCAAYFAKDIENWFGNGKLKVFVITVSSVNY